MAVPFVLAEEWWGRGMVQAVPHQTHCGALRKRLSRRIPASSAFHGTDRHQSSVRRKRVPSNKRGFRSDQQQADQGAKYGWQQFFANLEQVLARID
jgi:hypothetical protein